MVVDFRALFLQDDKTVLKNPHKGFYWHYIDNGFKRGAYRDAHDAADDLRDFPGLNHLYLRVDWDDLEHEEGVYNWALIDGIMDVWGPRGLNWSLRVVNSETSKAMCFATPEWVLGAGAKGQWIKYGEADDDRFWEPDYGDPVFLEKLDNFLCALAARYDGDPSLELIDIGSYGNWGEGHVIFSTKQDWPTDVLKRHIDMHVKHFRKTPVVVNDDMLIRSCAGYDMGERAEMIDYALMRGVGIRDDSVCVPGVIEFMYTGYDTLRDSRLYAPFAAQQLTDCELDHYSMFTSGPPNDACYAGGYKFMEAARSMQATFIGFHTYPRKWLKDNPYLAEYLANRCGYWYIPERAALPEWLIPGVPSMLYLDLENRGFARAYHKYDVKLFLSGCGGVYELPVAQACDNRQWLPGRPARQMVRFDVPAGLPEGGYDFEYGLFEARRPVLLGLNAKLKTARGTYTLAGIEVKKTI